MSFLHTFQGNPGFTGVKGEKGLPGPAGQRVSKNHI